MNKKYAFYCSGEASRIIKFYNEYNLVDYPISFVYYDGDNVKTLETLKTLFSDKLITKQSQPIISSNLISDILLYLLQKHQVDYLYCFGSKILKSPLIFIYKNKIINFHPSLLPAFPGINSIDQALSSSVQLLGNTAHFIDEGTDTGPIIMQSLISRSIYKTYESVLGLQIKMLNIIWHLLDENKIKVLNKRVQIDYQANNNPYFTIL